MNRAQLGLWGAIAGIFLLAILGIRSAASWLAQGTPTETNDPALTVTGTQANGNSVNDRLIGRRENSAARTREEDRIISDRNSDRIKAQTDQQTGGPTTLQTNTLTFSPLEEAGTYIQRQKSVERDDFVAATKVDAVALTSDAPTAAQSDSRVTQPAPATVVDSNQLSQPKPAAPTAPAVPALW